MVNLGNNVPLMHEPNTKEVVHGTVHFGVNSGSIVLLASIAVLLSALCLKFLPTPFVWLAWGWAVILFVGFWRIKVASVRVVAFNMAVLAAAFAPIETYSAIHLQVRPIYSEPYMLADDVLGTVPVKPTHAHSSEVEHGKLVYDVTYNIGEDGLRTAPPSSVDASTPAVLFFGCSFTFGEGVQDDETMPYQVGIQSGGHYQIYNFGFHGYGPHQMLASIESGRVRQVVRTTPRYALYQVLPDHVARVAGKVPYGQHSPRYRLEADGGVRLEGHFDDGRKPPSALRTILERRLGKSATYRLLKSLEPRITEDDIRLLLATVRKSRELLEAEYPGMEFHIILRQNFDYEAGTYRELLEGFRRMNIPVHLVEDILPDYNSNPQKYWLSRDDRHPNALQDRLIARYVVARILHDAGSNDSAARTSTDPPA